MAEADANIACFNAKFYYNYWRPITAIRLGDADGNANTAGDPAWDVLAPPTPRYPIIHLIILLMEVQVQKSSAIFLSR